MEKEKQKTAVELFAQRLIQRGIGYNKMDFEESNEMFEKQFKYSFTKGMGFCEIYGAPEEETKQDEIAKQLYNATFKKQEQ